MQNLILNQKLSEQSSIQILLRFFIFIYYVDLFTYIKIMQCVQNQLSARN